MHLAMHEKSLWSQTHNRWALHRFGFNTRNLKDGRQRRFGVSRCVYLQQPGIPQVAKIYTPAKPPNRRNQAERLFSLFASAPFSRLPT